MVHLDEPCTQGTEPRSLGLSALWFLHHALEKESTRCEMLETTLEKTTGSIIIGCSAGLQPGTELSTHHATPCRPEGRRY